MKPGYMMAILCVCSPLAQADIYKGVDENGHVTYSSTPIKGGKKLILEPLPTMAPLDSRGPEDFPSVDAETQKSRDDTRRKILENELDAEKKLLAEAEKNLQEGESNPEVYKGADGHTYRNVAKYDEKIKPLQEQVDMHKQNIKALDTELSNLSK